MQNIQEVFNKMREAAREQREIKAMYKNELNSTGDYQKLMEEMKILKDKKKKIEMAVEAQLLEEARKIDSLKKDINDYKQMISDIALTTLMKGESVKIEGPNGEEYEPAFSVKFKKKNV